MMKTKLTLLLASLLMALPLTARQGGQGGQGGGGHMAAIHASIYPPELLMRFAKEIGITESQRKEIRKVLKEANANNSDIQWDMQDATRRLAEIMSSDPVDEESAMTELDNVMALEARMKKSQLRAAIAIRNILTSEQKEKLNELRDKMMQRRQGGPGSRGQGGPGGRGNEKSGGRDFGFLPDGEAAAGFDFPG